jgi:hypothetical protein
MAMATTRSGRAARAAIAAAMLFAGCVATSGQLSAAGARHSAAAVDGVAAAPLGQAAVRETVLYADDHPDLFARAGSTRDALGFSKGAARKGRHVHDGIQKSDYDEVAEVDAAGQPTSLTQFDGMGRLLAAVRFDSPARSGAAVSSDQAGKAAARGLAAAGIPVAGAGRPTANGAVGGWDIHWDRVQAGFKVRGDETAVHVWQDGRIQSVARVEHDLAAAPPTPIGQAAAQAVVSRQCDSWFSGGDSGFGIAGMTLEWVVPNAAFDPARVGAAEGPYRLAWVANVNPTGSAAEAVRLVTLYVDAGDGAIIGGDVVE